MSPLRILTFNHHESYIASLAKTGHAFDVVVRRGALDLAWSGRSEPCPPNVRLVAFDAALEARLRAGEYDVVVCHTVKNLLWMFPYRKTPFVFIAHIPLFALTPVEAMKSRAKRLVFRAFRATHRLHFVAVSAFKGRSWAEPGTVIPLTGRDLGPPKADARADHALVVCNAIMARREELGLSDIERLAERLPIVVLGKNPGFERGVTPRDFAEFRERFRAGRIYLYTIRQPYGDGYNTAMLEAMMLGMAIVSVDNPSSPLTHGVDGLIGRSVAELEQHLRALMSDPALVDRLGRAARTLAEERFSEAAFTASWQRVLTATAALGPKRGGAS